MEHLFDEGYFDSNAITPQDYGKLMDINEWFWNRVDDFARGNVTNMNFSANGISITSEWEDYCRGCHMGTERETITVPLDVFYSNHYAPDWIKQQTARKQEEERQRKEQEEAERKRKEAAAQARRERAEYERLKAKFEGNAE